jgi:Undecaprenyl-phosphate galactose phosphotransferase WbaP
VTAAPLLLVDIVAVVGSLAAVHWGFAAFGLTLRGADLLYRTAPLLLVFVFVVRGLYPAVAMNDADEMRRLVTGSTLAFGAYLLVVGGILPGEVDGLGLACAWLLTTITLPYGRSSMRRMLARTRWWGCSALVVGDMPLKAESKLRIREQGLRLIREPVDGAEAHVQNGLVRSNAKWAIVYAGSQWPSELVQPDTLRFPNVLVVTPSDLDRAGRLWQQPKELGGLPAYHVRSGLHTLRSRILKRALDLFLVLLAAPLVLPAGALIALLIRTSSKGPVFFGHRRLGKRGRWFRAWKFRTMVPDGDAVLNRYLEQHPSMKQEWEATQKLRRDPRVTSIGRFLRKTSLDELPQLWNVLLGQMSLVGPRPIVEAESSRYGAVFGLYMEVAPGITGLWQVSGRNNTSYPERVRIDAFYVRNWSLWLDLHILLRTVRTVLTGEGAC